MGIFKKSSFYGYELEWCETKTLPFGMPHLWQLCIIKSSYHNNRKQILLTMANKIKEAGG